MQAQKRPFVNNPYFSTNFETDDRGQKFIIYGLFHTKHRCTLLLKYYHLSVSGFRFFMLLCYMAFKITLLREEFSANITLKTFLSCVGYKMVLQFSGVFENTKAEFTNKSFS